MTKTISAIYDTLSAMSTFIKTLTAWFGFGPIVVMLFLLFFVKLFQSFLGAGKISGFFFSFISVTALWLTWNISYYQEYRLLEVARIYGFIFLHLGGIFLLFHLFSRAGKSIWVALKNRKSGPYNVIDLYEKIDEGMFIAKKHLKNRDPASALKAIREIEGFLQKIPGDRVSQNNQPATTAPPDHD